MLDFVPRRTLRIAGSALSRELAYLNGNIIESSKRLTLHVDVDNVDDDHDVDDEDAAAPPPGSSTYTCLLGSSIRVPELGEAQEAVRRWHDPEPDERGRADGLQPTSSLGWVEAELEALRGRASRLGYYFCGCGCGCQWIGAVLYRPGEEDELRGRSCYLVWGPIPA